MLSLPVGLNPKDTEQMGKFMAVLKRLNENPDFNVFVEVMEASRLKYLDELANLNITQPDSEYAQKAKAIAAKYQVHSELAKFVKDFVELNEQGQRDKDRLDNLDPYVKVTHNKTN